MKKIIAAFALMCLLTSCGGAGVINTSNTATGMAVPSTLTVYGGEDMGFCFLYPKGMISDYNETDGVILYDGEEGTVPYLLVKKTDKKGMTPERYYSACEKQLLKEFNNVQYADTYQVPLGEKALYLTRYQCNDLMFDRYLELCDDCYVEYTAVSSEKDELNTAVYYVAQTLTLEPAGYIGAYSTGMTDCTHSDSGISIQIPSMMEIKDLSMGYVASTNDATLLAIHCTEDDYGETIYNRQDFMDRAAADSEFVAGYLGAEAAEFGSGTEMIVNGNSFYCYPMTLVSGGEGYTGMIALANAPETGCIMVSYAVKDTYGQHENVSKLCEQALNSVKF